MMFEGKKFILGVTGSIACYKSCQLLRKLQEEGAQVKVVMTDNATKFINPLTFQTLSGNPVYLKMFNKLDKNTQIQASNHEELVHIKLTQWADAMFVAPATANIISKTACGIADDLLSTLLISFQGPIIFAPAMDEGMYKNVIFRENLGKLKDKGYYIVPVDKGVLASGKTGEGRFASIEDIIKNIKHALSAKPARGDVTLGQAGGEYLRSVKILITAGGTREFLDPIRFIGNASSGKMGYALAQVAKIRGADVKLISAPTLLSQPDGIEIINVVTARQMRDKVIQNFASTDVLIMASAVGDFRSKTLIKQKRKRAEGQWDIKLIPNSDILLEVGKIKKDKITVGFSIETKNQINVAKEKLKTKNLDLIVANDINIKNSGFCSDTNKAILISKNGKKEELPLLSKKELADRILDKIQNIGRNKWKNRK
ncbi:bifunctional phosphopantothenoylcysteine decarboxylase/phosphopantothenate--cysteine ligase CoaBC [bacterium]|nr:bifunctional phosphopantothenoylcysteine decarboxylase/phosphopantothenate--cysteine ligase CoaBC [bacterium]